MSTSGNKQEHTKLKPVAQVYTPVVESKVPASLGRINTSGLDGSTTEFGGGTPAAYVVRERESKHNTYVCE